MGFGGAGSREIIARERDTGLGLDVLSVLRLRWCKAACRTEFALFPTATTARSTSLRFVTHRPPSEREAVLDDRDDYA